MLITQQAPESYMNLHESLSADTIQILSGELDRKIEVETPEEAAYIAVAFLESLLEQKYGETGESPKEFHDKGHSRMIADLSRKVTDTIIERGLGYVLLGMSKSEYSALEGYHKDQLVHSLQMRNLLAYQTCLAFAHDIRQDGDLVERTDISIVPIKQLARKRGPSVDQNEGGSGLDLSNLLEKFVYAGTSTPVFGGFTQRRCIGDVNATFVDFKQVVEEGFSGFMLVQPYFNEATIFGQILALVDIGGNLGITEESGEYYRSIVNTGNREFAELFPELSSKISNPETPPKERFAALLKAFEWIKSSQTSFVDTQIWLQKRHIEQMAEKYSCSELETVLLEVFNGFDKTSEEVARRAKNLANLPITENTTLEDWLDQTCVCLSPAYGAPYTIHAEKLAIAAQTISKYLEY